MDLSMKNILACEKVAALVLVDDKKAKDLF